MNGDAEAAADAAFPADGRSTRCRLRRPAGDYVACGRLCSNKHNEGNAFKPFGRVKESGYGREGGTERLQCYTVARACRTR
jgi:acyl-CoA reductase-like NAD-dependent aldehyde dehydrogenase